MQKPSMGRAFRRNTFAALSYPNYRLVQTLVPDAVRGRVMGLYMLSFFGFMPIGALLAGGVAVALGVPVTVAISAACFLACAVAVARAVPSIRRLG